MKIILTILCGAVILFVGGCVATLGGDGGPIAVASWIVVGINLLLIAGMWALPGKLRPLFIVMALVDFGVALMLVWPIVLETGMDPEFRFWIMLPAAAFLAKGILSLKVSRKV